MKKMLPVFILIAVLVVGGAFYGGMKFGQSKGLRNDSFGAKNLANWQGQGGDNQKRLGVNGGSKMGFGGGLVNGEILSKDDKSLTVSMPNNGSKIIFLTDSSQIMKSDAGNVDDLEIGQSVMITGKTNADGSVTAEIVQVRPRMNLDVPSAPILETK